MVRPLRSLSWLWTSLALILGGFGGWWLGRTDAPQPVPEAPVFSLAGKTYTRAELPAPYPKALKQLHQQVDLAEHRLLATAALEIYLDRETRRLNLSRQELEARVFDVTPPTSAAISSFYRDNRERIGVELDEARASISKLLLRERRQHEQDALVAKLVNLGELEFTRTPPAD
ncbi:hypothetical protein [Motiliproteus sp. SC1-56]|uniref:hypothetical protein n=1 Tax=Motiliproteus sp. SC1-56 TaxID=2799565 RepID=UPI001A8CEC15|nr:hypothetical protein [Motiliproteus sp. SC1-56]